MKWRKEDRNREKEANNLERKRIHREEKDLGEIQTFRLTQAALSTLPKILDSQQLDIAIETLESALQQNHIPTCSWNYMLFTALTGKFQELAADFPIARQYLIWNSRSICCKLLDTLEMLWDYNFGTIAMTYIALCLLLSGSPDKNDL